MALRIAVLRGGPSHEYDISLKSGEHIISQIDSPEYEVYDVVVNPHGVWHHQGVEVQPADFIQKIDLLLNAIHGEYGEDGELQRFLETHNVLHNSSSAYASAVSMNKQLTKDILQKGGIKVPKGILVKKEEVQSKADIEQVALEVVRHFTLPVIIKPVSKGSSFGMTLAKSFHQIEYGVELALNFDDAVLIEEYISGKEASVGVIDGFRNQDHYSLLPTEIRHSSKEGFFDLSTKYGKEEHLYTPGSFSQHEKEELQLIAIEAHKLLGLSHISRSDFIVHPKRGVYFLEINSVPGMTEQSIIPHSLRAIGSTTKEMFDHMIKRILKRS